MGRNSFLNRVVTVAVLAVLVTVAYSCKENKAASHNVMIRRDSALLYELPVASGKIMGTYSGDFKGSPIIITLRYIAGKRISGYNIHKGLRRNITGTILLDGDRLHLKLQEPGTNQYDGNFDIFLDTVSLEMKGKWQPLNNSELGTARFTLTPQPKEQYWSMYLTDSTGVELDMNADGSCTYSYMVNDSTAAAQKLSFTGNFRFAKDSASIQFFWQANEIFPGKQSVFTVEKKWDEEMGEHATVLKGEGKELHEMMMF